MMAGLREALMPRTAAARASGAPWYSPKVGLASILDQASLPGRAYVSLGRPEGETYLDALGRTEPRYDIAGYQGEGDELAETLLRDPSLPLGVAGGMVRGLGRVGRAVADAGIGAATGGADQYAQGRRVSLGDLIGSAALGAVPSVAMGGKAPVSRMANEITPEQRAANFRNWFGDSKVVDEAGNPLNLKHGTYSPKFDVFDVSGESGLHPTAKIGAFFTPDEDIAKGFGNRVEDVYLKASNPYEMSAEDYYNTFSREKEFERLRLLNSAKAREVLETAESGEGGIPDKLIEKRVRSLLREMDSNENDALLVKAYDPGWDEIPDRALRGNWKELNKDVWVVRNPTQIKSATGNRGTFDPNDPNITHFAGRAPTARQPTPIQALGNRINRGAAEASLRDYLSDGRKEQVGGPVRTGLGGFLLASPGDTPYTRRTR